MRVSRGFPMMNDVSVDGKMFHVNDAEKRHSQPQLDDIHNSLQSLKCHRCGNLCINNRRVENFFISLRFETLRAHMFELEMRQSKERGEIQLHNSP